MSCAVVRSALFTPKTSSSGQTISLSSELKRRTLPERLTFQSRGVCSSLIRNSSVVIPPPLEHQLRIKFEQPVQIQPVPRVDRHVRRYSVPLTQMLSRGSFILSPRRHYSQFSTATARDHEQHDLRTLGLRFPLANFLHPGRRTARQPVH